MDEMSLWMGYDICFEAGGNKHGLLRRICPSLDRPKGDRLMQLSAVALARFIAFIEIGELDPRGRIAFPDLSQSLTAEFGFQKYPQKYEEFDLQKGIEFARGKWKKGGVEKLTIFGGGLAVETRSSTDDSEDFLNEFLSWGAAKFGIQYRRDMIKHVGYVSQVVFYTEVPVLALLSSPVAKLSERVSGSVEEVLREKIHYEPTGLWIGIDQLTRKLSPAAFSIQRRVDVPFSENKYFSEAPLPTEVHLTLLREFEADVLSYRAARK